MFSDRTRITIVIKLRTEIRKTRLKQIENRNPRMTKTLCQVEGEMTERAMEEDLVFVEVNG